MRLSRVRSADTRFSEAWDIGRTMSGNDMIHFKQFRRGRTSVDSATAQHHPILFSEYKGVRILCLAEGR